LLKAKAKAQSKQGLKFDAGRRVRKSPYFRQTQLKQTERTRCETETGVCVCVCVCVCIVVAVAVAAVPICCSEI